MRIWTWILGAILALAALFVYLIPSVIAFRNKHPARGAIFLVNLFLGITILGYVGALLWATAPKPLPEK